MRIGSVSSLIVSLSTNPATRKRALFLKGASGIGKSEIVWQAAQARGIPVIDARLAQFDPVDLRGVPSVNEVQHTTEWNVPAMFPRDPDSEGILFLDEITSAPPAIQAVAYQLILDRKIGEYSLPDGWFIVAAGNRANDRGVTFAMAAPLLNRMTEVEVDTVLDDFVEYAVTKNIRPEILAFLSDRADYLHKFDKDTYGQQFPSPRGWFAASNLMDMEFSPTVRVELLKGTVGRAAAVDFESFLRVWETMPSLDAILEGKDIAVPAELNVRYCVTMGLAARIDKKTFGNAWAFLKKMPKEFQTLCVKLAYQRDNTLIQAPKFSEWAMENQDAFRRV